MRAILLVGGLLALAAPLWGQAPPSPPSPLPDQQTAETLGTSDDAASRLTVPVSIGGQGPFPFVIDTGSERTVISRELAQTLRLGPGRPAMVHSMTEASRIPTVVLDELQVGSRRMRDIHAPALAQTNLGAVGMLGVDSLQSQRVVFDFERKEMTVTPSRRRDERWDGDTIVITARNRFGRLILVDASVDGQRVYVIVDTGAQFTIGNDALRRRLERRGRLGPTVPVGLVSVTGGELRADAAVAQRVQLGGLTIEHLPVAFADAHVFRQLRLTNRPAILLGMDALRLFDRVSVDFANRRVRLLMPESSSAPPPRRFAAAAPGRARR
ncbi:aspartyl protease family protein [Sphingosinicella sp. LHD-64]|uniref:aspartyl protease family protein n=1 Tax=Sphingosinicella sp. LHD-64 TaxID=3072139 RepID=UPI0028105BD8|nr:aspartyl protease family protein [Sphingosinicella sp. LHD-64]MDQ8756172.1 aspartyl protease family protein [Sphingosinicella sp. LHD-64]